MTLAFNPVFLYFGLGFAGVATVARIVLGWAISFS